MPTIKIFYIFIYKDISVSKYNGNSKYYAGRMMIKKEKWFLQLSPTFIIQKENHMGTLPNHWWQFYGE